VEETQVVSRTDLKKKKMRAEGVSNEHGELVVQLDLMSAYMKSCSTLKVETVVAT
jgi:hypothetical protein